MQELKKKNSVEKQLSLDLGYVTNYARENLIISRANCEAIGLMDQWPHWHTPVTVLVGGHGAGKSHIAMLWRERARAFCGQDLSHAVEAAISGQSVLIEDIGFSQIDEVAFFHLINAIWQSFSLNGQTCLLLTSCTRPAVWPLTIADLISRLRVVNLVEIGLPDDMLLRGVLVKLLADRQLIIEASVIEYIVSRVERSLFVVNQLVDQLDARVIDEKRRLSRQLVANVLSDLQHRDDEFLT